MTETPHTGKSFHLALRLLSWAIPTTRYLLAQVNLSGQQGYEHSLGYPLFVVRARLTNKFPSCAVHWRSNID